MNVKVHLFETRDRDTMDRIARVRWVIMEELNTDTTLWYTPAHDTMALAAMMDAEHVMAQVTALRPILDMYGKRAGEEGYCGALARHGTSRDYCGVALNIDESCPNGKRHVLPICHRDCLKCRAINTGRKTEGLLHWFGQE